MGFRSMAFMTAITLIWNLRFSSYSVNNMLLKLWYVLISKASRIVSVVFHHAQNFVTLLAFGAGSSGCAQAL